MRAIQWRGVDWEEFWVERAETGSRGRSHDTISVEIRFKENYVSFAFERGKG